MKIAEIRQTINSLIWTIADLEGATRDEFRQMNVPDRLYPLINKCMELDIKIRFTKDITACNRAIERAHAMLHRWFTVTK